MDIVKKLPRTLILAALAGFVGGVLWLAGVHVLTQSGDDVHYHANFALYINGERDEFDDPTFYEEVQSCSAEGSDPKTRVHMHDMVNHVIHVHEPGVTWGHFFANLSYALGNNLIKTDDGVFVDGEGGKLTFILNGNEIGSVANRLIESGDMLLIDYGDSSKSELGERYDAIPKDAEEYNKKSDPSACSGPEELTIPIRLKRAFGL